MSSDSNAIHGFTFHALGGAGRLRIACVSEAAARDAVVAVVKWLREAEARYSRFQTDSFVSRLNRGEVVEAEVGLLALLDAAKLAYRSTSGRLDATASPLWSMWHDPERSTWPRTEEIERVMRLRGLHEIVCENGAVCSPRAGLALDLGGIGKEWCVDEIVVLLERRGLRHFLVELAGDVAARGCQSAKHNGWWVLLPGCARAYLLHDAALATSGHGARFRWLGGRSVSHLIDAQTGLPALGNVRSVTVTAPSCCRW